jgi:hypothetical protein
MIVIAPQSDIVLQEDTWAVHALVSFVFLVAV